MAIEKLVAAESSIRSNETWCLETHNGCTTLLVAGCHNRKGDWWIGIIRVFEEILTEFPDAVGYLRYCDLEVETMNETEYLTVSFRPPTLAR